MSEFKLASDKSCSTLWHFDIDCNIPRHFITVFVFQTIFCRDACEIFDSNCCMRMPMGRVMKAGTQAVSHCLANESCDNSKPSRLSPPMPLQFEVALHALVVNIDVVAAHEMFCTDLRAGNIQFSSFHFAMHVWRPW